MEEVLPSPPEHQTLPVLRDPQVLLLFPEWDGTEYTGSRLLFEQQQRQWTPPQLDKANPQDKGTGHPASSLTGPLIPAQGFMGRNSVTNFQPPRVGTMNPQPYASGSCLFCSWTQTCPLGQSVHLHNGDLPAPPGGREGSPAPSAPLEASP
jgi:hypothetical protein